MSLVPCFACATKEMEMRKEIAKAERARATGRSVAIHMERVAGIKVDLLRCEHSSMENGRDASRARHAAGRVKRGQA